MNAIALLTEKLTVPAMLSGCQARIGQQWVSFQALSHCP